MFEDLTMESIRDEMLADLAEADTQEGSYTSNIVSGVALKLWSICKSLDAMIPISFVDKTSGQYIDMRAGEFGIKRKEGTRAAVMLSFTGSDGALIPEGALFLTDNGIEFVTTSEVRIENGAAMAPAAAVLIGSAGNVPAQTILRRASGAAGVATVINEQPAAGGSDPESDESLVNRLYAYWRKPVTSGNAYSYEKWACEVNGVSAAKAIPLWNGNGTVKVLLAGENRKPVDTAVVARCAAHIEQERPIGAEVTVVSASAFSIDIAANVQLKEGAESEKVLASFQERLSQYFTDIAFTQYELLYNRVVYLLLDTDGVIDFTSLTVGGGTSNVTIPDDAVPVLGTVVVQA